MKPVLTIILAFFLGATLVAQPLEKGLLWKISGNDLDTASYLYATIHLMCPEDMNLADNALEAVRQTGVVVLELDFDEPGLMASLQQYLFLEDGLSARDYLTEEDYALVSDFFSERLGMPFGQLDRIKPFFLSTMVLLETLGCEPVSPEQTFAALAAEQGKEVIGLETVEEQVRFVDNIPLEDIARILVSDIREAGSGEEMADEMVQTYLAGDLDGIQRIMDEYMGGEYTDIQEDMIIGRNRDWVPKIEELVSVQPSFIAVGAGHLTGKKGLIRLLRKKGYTVEPVR